MQRRAAVKKPSRNFLVQLNSAVLACFKFIPGKYCFTLTISLRSHSDRYNPREIAHLDYISQLTTDIRHIDGTNNEVADMLSRPSLSSLHLSHGIDLCAMAAVQQRVGCPGDESVSGLQLKDVPLITGSGTILCDVSTLLHRPFVPASMRRAVFQTLHGLSHPGIRASQKLLAERFVWPGMNKDVKAWTRSCLSRQRNKVQRLNKSPIGTYPSPDARFGHVHLDVVGPLPLSNGFTHPLICIDRYTRWAEAIPLPNAQAETIVKAFVSRWVAMFGAPSTVTNDRGAQFESTLFQMLLNFLGCTRIRTTAYHPAANGMVECFHRQLKTALRAVEDAGNWSDNFPLALLVIRAALKLDLGCSAAELVFGTTLRLPGEMITPTSRRTDETPDNLLLRLRQFMRSLSPVPPRNPMRKSVSQGIDATVFYGSSGPGPAFYVCDTATRRRFLVDTGAKISIVPPTAADSRFPSPGLHLQAAKPSPIPTFGSLSFTLIIGLRRSFTWIFLIGDVPHASLGSDFLAEFDLLVDCRRACLLNRTTSLFVRGLTSFTAPTNLSVFDTDISFTDHVLRGLPFVYAYIDDLSVASRNEEERKKHSALMFDRLNKFGVVINPSKCVLCVPSLEFLGHQVDSEGLRPLPSKVEAVRNFPPPTFKRQVQRFLGMVNFYRRFLPNCVDLMLPLTNLLSGPKGPLELRGHALTAFEGIKTSLADATLLTHPAPEASLSLMVDASTVAVGAVLQQHLAGSTQPFAFFPEKLLPAETRYSTFDREILSIYLAVNNFRHFLGGREFTVFTDHKPYNPREIAHLDYISQLTTDIRHIDGTNNEVADMLSRPSLSSLHLSHGIDLCAMAAVQQRVGCPGDESVSGLQLKDVPLITGSGTILCDVSTLLHRPFVPASMRRAVFQTLHGLSHPGIRASQKLLAERFVWPGMNKDVKAWTRSCLSRQRNKVQRLNKSPIGTYPSPDARFGHVHLDVVGPLPLSNGFTHPLICIDRYTRWAEAIPLPNAQAETIVKAFVSRWVAMFGAPSTVTNDCGAQFESTLFQMLLNFLGCTRIRTTAYHPAANGMVECFHRQLKTALRAVEDAGNWSDNFPLALLVIRAALKLDLGCSAAELVFGTTLRLPGEMITPTSRRTDETPDNLLLRLRQFMRSLSPVPPRNPMSES
ncbi:hypothetical protein SprV_0501752100 [Sparganum proliferum]